MEEQLQTLDQEINEKKKKGERRRLNLLKAALMNDLDAIDLKMLDYQVPQV